MAIKIIQEAPDELCHRISAGGDDKDQYAVLRFKAGSNMNGLVQVLRRILHEIEPRTSGQKIRVQIKDESLLNQAIEKLNEFEYNFIDRNGQGDCLYIWTNGSKKASRSHWTEDNPYIQIDESNFLWLLNTI